MVKTIKNSLAISYFLLLVSQWAEYRAVLRSMWKRVVLCFSITGRKSRSERKRLMRFWEVQQEFYRQDVCYCLLLFYTAMLIGVSIQNVEIQSYGLDKVAMFFVACLSSFSNVGGGLFNLSSYMIEGYMHITS